LKNLKKITRRKALWMMAVTGLTGLGTAAWANTKNIGAMMPGKGWLKQGDKCTGDGTPLQFIPKTDPDPDPLKDELNKYKMSLLRYGQKDVEPLPASCAL